MGRPVCEPKELPMTASEEVLARLMSPEGLADPYPHYHALRALAPVCQAGHVYFLSGYAACREVLADPRFRVQDPAWYDGKLPGWRDCTATRLMYQSVQSRNDPDHSRLRRLLAGAFSPRQMAAYRALIERVVPRLLDRMADAGPGPVDLMTHLAYPLPTAVMGEMLGVPEADRERFRDLGTDFFTVMDMYADSSATERMEAAAAAMGDYWTAMIDDRRRTPRDDLTTALTQASDAGLLSADELLGVAIFLFSAGYGTTAALVGNATEQLLASPAEADRLRRDDGYVDAVVEESLRHEPPSQVVPRMTGEDTVLGGVAIPAATLLVCLVGAAQRDPGEYPDPDRFWPSRPGGRVLSFGGGVHFCIGAALSRMEAAVVLPLLFRRFPRLALAGTPERRLALRMRMHASLPVSLRG
jgi:cytochrome P450